MGKIENKLELNNQALADVLNKYSEVHLPAETALALDYESLQLYYALEALRLYMSDRMLEPNYEVVLNE